MSGARPLRSASRSASDLDAVADDIQGQGGRAQALVLDVNDTTRCSEVLASAEPFGVSINNAGTNRPAPFVEVSTSDYDDVFGLNVRAAFFVAQAVARTLLKTKIAGSIVNIPSQMGHVGAADRTVYCATKHAIEGLTKAMAAELGPQQHPGQQPVPDLHRNRDDGALSSRSRLPEIRPGQHQARTVRALEGRDGRDRLPRLGCVRIGDRRGPHARRQLDKHQLTAQSAVPATTTRARGVVLTTVFGFDRPLPHGRAERPVSDGKRTSTIHPNSVARGGTTPPRT